MNLDVNISELTVLEQISNKNLKYQNENTVDSRYLDFGYLE